MAASRCFPRRRRRAADQAAGGRGRRRAARRHPAAAVTWAWLMRRACRMTRAAAAAAVLAALGGAVPAALARYVGWPLPRQLTGAHVRALVTAPLTDTALVKILACVVWAAWAFFILCVAAEIAARLRGRPCPRLPAISGAQALAAALVGAVIVTTSPGAASTSAARAAAPVSVAASYRPA